MYIPRVLFVEIPSAWKVAVSQKNVKAKTLALLFFGNAIKRLRSEKFGQLLCEDKAAFAGHVFRESRSCSAAAAGTGLEK
jgi:hypothetical protein